MKNSRISPTSTNVPNLSVDGWRAVEKAVRQAQGEIPVPDISDEIANFTVDYNIEEQDHNDTSHMEKSPSSPWGGREVQDGFLTTYKVTAKLSGTVSIPDTEVVKTTVRHDFETYPEILSDFLDGARAEIGAGLDSLDADQPTVLSVEAMLTEGGCSVTANVEQYYTGYKDINTVSEEQNDARTDFDEVYP